MTSHDAHASRGPSIAEIGLLALVVLSLVFVVVNLFQYGYLPSPYFYDVDDTFMDWFNTAYWANHPGAYTIWRTVYPPLSFVFLHVFSINACYNWDPYFGRQCDWVGMGTILSFFLLNIFLVFRSYLISDAKTSLVRTAALCLGFPMLYTLERGNLILPTFAFFVLGCGRYVRSARLKWVSLAIAVNFKPYLVAILIARLVQRRWRWVEGCALAVVLVYLASFAFEGDGTPQVILADIKSFATELPTSQLLSQSYYSTAYAPIAALLNSTFPLVDSLGSRTVEALSFWIPTLIRTGQIGAMLAMAGAFFRPMATPSHRLAALLVALVITSTDPGGYAQLFLLFLIFFEKWQGAIRIYLLVLAYVLSLSFDVPLFQIEHHVRNVYLTGRAADYSMNVYVGEFLRPLVIILMEYGLIALILKDVWSALKPAVIDSAQSGATIEPQTGAGIA